MREVDSFFLKILSAALHGRPALIGNNLKRKTRREIIHMSAKHRVLPMIIQASWEADTDKEKITQPFLRSAKELTCNQAQRTADFLILYTYLSNRGLHPVVLKGAVVRSMYPYPEQRSSVDEDLLIGSEEIDALHAELLDFGLSPEGDEDHRISQETTYRDRQRGLYIEVHREMFSTDSGAYSECNSLFKGVLGRTINVYIYGVPVRTLAPTDHLMFLICHAYKHFLYGGVGIRQICDICIMAEKWYEIIDWEIIRNKSEEVHISKYAAGLFRIGERYLDSQMPDIFKDISVNPDPLLEDVLSGGLYGVSDINRAHSAIMTLDAVAADRAGKKMRAVTNSVFLPMRTMSKKYPYLRKLPFLLPVAWLQRVAGYISERKGLGLVDPSRTIQIGRKRIDLLRKYDIIR